MSDMLEQFIAKHKIQTGTGKSELAEILVSNVTEIGFCIIQILAAENAFRSEVPA